MSTQQTFAPVSGTAGRVVNVNTGVAIAGVSSWSFPHTAAIIPIPHFESSADANGTVYPNKLKGLGDAKVSLAGIYNTNATDNTETGTSGLANGLYVSLTLVTSKTSGVGYSPVVGWVSNFTPGTKIDNQAANFTCDIEVDGVPPAFGNVTI